MNIFRTPLLEFAIILCSIFGLIGAIFSFDLPVVRDAIAIIFIIYGIICFPYKKVDQYLRPGLGTGCVIITFSGILSYFLYSWWFLPGAIIGFVVAGLINAKYDRY